MKNNIEIKEIIEKIKKEDEEVCMVLNDNKNMLLSLGKSIYQNKDTMFLLVSTSNLNDVDYHYFTEINLSKDIVLEDEVEIISNKYQEFYKKYMHNK